MSEGGSRGEIVSIQVLRAVAAIMVMFVHIGHDLARLKFAHLETGWLSLGVDIFFVISGFIMWTSVERRPGISASHFLKNRIIRIVPLYWSVTTFILLAALLAPQLMTTTSLRLTHVIASYLFLPARHPTAGVFWPLAVPGWSLNFEMLFYVIFAIALSASARRAWLRFILIAAMLLLLMLIAFVTRAYIDPMNFYANPMLMEFLAGIALGVVYQAGIVRSSRLWIAFSMLGFCMLARLLAVPGGFAVTLLSATMIVAGAVFSPPFRPNPLSAIGDASYSLYLTHIIPIAAITWLCRKLLPSLGAPLFVLFSVASALALAMIVHAYVEVPLTRVLRRRGSNRSAIAQPIASTSTC